MTPPLKDSTLSHKGQHAEPSSRLVCIFAFSFLWPVFSISHSVHNGFLFTAEGELMEPNRLNCGVKKIRDCVCLSMSFLKYKHRVGCITNAFI